MPIKDLLNQLPRWVTFWETNATEVFRFHFQNVETEQKYAKRNITSNWAKYEIPDDDEETEDDTERTGPDYEYVLSTAQGAEAHFKFKYEQEWEREAGK